MAVFRGSDLVDDILAGSAGNDVMFGFGGSDALDSGDGNDRLYGGEGEDLFAGGDGKDRLFGGAGTDVIRGGEGNDRIDGGTGNDIIAGDKGNDYLTGGEGADSFYFGGLSGKDTITDFQQETDLQRGDTIDLVGLGLAFEDLDIRVKDDGVMIDTGHGRIFLENFTGTVTPADFDFGI